MSYLLECIDCKRRYVPGEVQYLCPTCSENQKPMEPLVGILRCIYDYEAIIKRFSPSELKKRDGTTFFRFSELFPLRSTDTIPPLVVGATPLRQASHLRRAIDLENLWIKDDTVSPTASFKDRASAMVVACARERGLDAVATASTGNAATALAGMAASVGMRSIIFAPSSAPQAKLTQIVVYGGTLIPIKGTYDEAFELSIRACSEFGWYNRNTAYNPFTVEGKKTAALEIWEQLKYRAPDWVVVPTGDGVILAGIEKGFADLKALGIIDRLPRLALVQAIGCQPLVRALVHKSDCIVPEPKPRTIADSICVGVPRAGRWVLKAVADCEGAAVAVTDDEIIDAIALLGQATGVFAEPAAATAIAGLKKLVEDGTISRDECVVALITGSGLKDIPAASRAAKIGREIEPSLDAVKRFIDLKLETNSF